MELNLQKDRPIKGFFHDYRFLSNFWIISVEYEGLRYPSSEHAFQAAKTLDVEFRKEFLLDNHPQYAKNLGRSAKMKQLMRPDWNDIRDDVMFELLRIKFSKPLYRTKLLATGNAYLEETNTWGDHYWGVCQGKGENRLGELLMKLRTILREEDECSPKLTLFKVLNKKTDLPTPNTVYVGRPSKWGNPYVVGKDVKNNKEACERFHDYLEAHPELKEAAKRELRGKDLMCWCAPDDCHADELLVVANS